MQDKPFTIREYADYVLSLPQIKQALEAFTVYQTVVDRMIDSWHDMVETEKVPFRVETTHEELALHDILKDMGNVIKVGDTKLINIIEITTDS